MSKSARSSCARMWKRLWKVCVTPVIIKKSRSKFCSSINPSWIPLLTTLQLRNALTEVFLPLESVQVGMGYMKPDIMEKTVKVTNEYFDVGRKVTSQGSFHQPIHQALIAAVSGNFPCRR